VNETTEELAVWTIPCMLHQNDCRFRVQLNSLYLFAVVLTIREWHYDNQSKQIAWHNLLLTDWACLGLDCHVQPSMEWYAAKPDSHSTRPINQSSYKRSSLVASTKSTLPWWQTVLVLIKGCMVNGRLS